jgi:hypothetical protein
VCTYINKVYICTQVKEVIYDLKLLIMVVSSDFRVCFLLILFNESFLYNNRIFDSKFITEDQYSLNRDYVLARRSEQGGGYLALFLYNF